MSITPTPHLFRALSAADIAKPAAPVKARAQQAFANAIGDAGGAPSAPAQKPQPPGQGEKTAADRAPHETRRTTSPETSDSGGKPAVAANHRREAVGSARPQYQQPGSLVDIRV